MGTMETDKTQVTEEPTGLSDFIRDAFLARMFLFNFFKVKSMS